MIYVFIIHNVKGKYFYNICFVIFADKNGLEKGRGVDFVISSYYDMMIVYFELVYLVTALVPSLTACLANSPGNKSLTAV